MRIASQSEVIRPSGPCCPRIFHDMGTTSHLRGGPRRCGSGMSPPPPPPPGSKSMSRHACSAPPFPTALPRPPPPLCSSNPSSSSPPPPNTQNCQGCVCSVAPITLHGRRVLLALGTKPADRASGRQAGKTVVVAALTRQRESAPSAPVARHQQLQVDGSLSD